MPEASPMTGPDVSSADRRGASAEPARGPVAPTASAHVAHHPLGMARTTGAVGVELTGGLLRDWRHRNREASLPLAFRQLEVAGNLDNLRLAIAANLSAAEANGAEAGRGRGPDQAEAAAPSGHAADTRYRGPVFMDSDVYKTLEAVGWEQTRDVSPELTRFTGDAIALLEQAQLPDGYLNSFFQATGAPRYSRLQSSHEMYCAGHLIQAAIAYQRGPGDGRLLGVARRFADHLVRTFLGSPQPKAAAGTNPGIDGHPIIETALAELYRETGHEPYLQLAGQFLEQRGHGIIGDYAGMGSRYLQDHLPVRQAPTVTGHVVRALYLEAGIVDVATETGDTELLESSIARWAEMAAARTYLTGGNGSRHSAESFGDAYELPPDRAYNETCAAIAAIQWSWRLLLATGEAKYADHMERVLYNGFAGSISADGTRFFYVNPLQRRVDHFEGDDPGRRHEWFSCACCPPNIMRMLASLEHYLATTAGDTLYVHQFADARVAANLTGGTLSVEMKTAYPWSGAVELRVREAPAGPAGLAVRVPAWSRGPVFAVNGQLVPAPDDGYLVIERNWRPGDTVTCDLRVAARLTYPGRRFDAIRGTVALERGPLVYCFEQVDQGQQAGLEDLAVLPGGTGSLRERQADLPGAGPVITIETDAICQADAAGEPPYTTTPGGAPAGTPATATAIPYFQWDNRDSGPMRVWLPVADRQPE
ncbi:MAG TPA: beta-L-arabinofuranosidase domain-containing protein [Trebonia sp.]|nr:beta-L-arabinofuranosidase domain-containing protein [Trebonia sp.]